MAALLLANRTPIAFGLSRTDGGLFGFNELGWEPSPEAAIALIAEIAAAAGACGLLALAVRSAGEMRSPPRR